MKELKQESEEAMREFYRVSDISGKAEIPSILDSTEKRRIWAYQNGYTAIGYHEHTHIWYAYN